MSEIQSNPEPRRNRRLGLRAKLMCYVGLGVIALSVLSGCNVSAESSPYNTPDMPVYDPDSVNRPSNPKTQYGTNCYGYSLNILQKFIKNHIPQYPGMLSGRTPLEQSEISCEVVDERVQSDLMTIPGSYVQDSCEQTCSDGTYQIVSAVGVGTIPQKNVDGTYELVSDYHFYRLDFLRDGTRGSYSHKLGQNKVINDNRSNPTQLGNPLMTIDDVLKDAQVRNYDACKANCYCVAYKN